MDANHTLQYTLPTKPGLYLWSGARQSPDIHNLARMRVEVVRIYRNDAGHLNYIGLDFFYSPNESVGAWIRIDEVADTLMHAAQQENLRHLVKTKIVPLFETWGEHLSTGNLLHGLQRWSTMQEAQASAQLLFDHAVAAGDIVPSPLRGDGWWSLRSA